MSRIATFVRAARAMLWMQVAAAVLATGLGIWAIVAVRDLAIERDMLADQVLELQRGRPEAEPMASPTGVASSPLDSEVRPPAIMPVYVPILTDPAITPPIPPIDIPPRETPVEQPDVNPPPPTAEECAGLNADRRRCRPGRWTQRDPAVVAQPVAPRPTEQPQRGTDAPRLD